MIKKSGDGYKVVSKGGKNLSKPGMSLKDAMMRLSQIEWFKKHKEQ